MFFKPDFKPGTLRIVPTKGPRYAPKWEVEEYRRGFLFYDWFYVTNAETLIEARDSVAFLENEKVAT